MKIIKKITKINKSIQLQEDRMLRLKNSNFKKSSNIFVNMNPCTLTKLSLKNLALNSRKESTSKSIKRGFILVKLWKLKITQGIPKSQSMVKEFLYIICLVKMRIISEFMKVNG